MSANNRIRFGLKIAFVCLYITPSQYHHCANLSGDIELIKCQIYFVGCKIEHILAVTHYTIYGDVCFQLTHSPCDDWENIYTLSYHRQIGSMVCTFTHCLRLGHEIMVRAVFLSIVLWISNATWKQYNSNLRRMWCTWHLRDLPLLPSPWKVWIEFHQQSFPIIF